MGTFNVSLKTLTDRVSMEVVYTPRALDEISVEIAEVNRPGLFLAGYYDYFDKLRLQIMCLPEPMGHLPIRWNTQWQIQGMTVTRREPLEWNL